ncbi:MULTISPECIES: DUF6011 domain-containing protein [unclassified Streptomyces]|uniref:DUF6011 domain-containing protein n=1 Tax=unclassified Streptomyces TaxID=2593676 RepID=UPI00109E506A|nr:MULTISPECIES: DUF6011 domain-containing protein [unclassified Streptomyces]MBT2453310.1 hypothetical protein [Streptomyces sp. ISL-86]THA54285.1 hypothetical protein E6R62_17145 [Streptomyces sp. A1136]
MTATLDWPELDALEDGYYAILDPDGAGTVTYWRRTRSARMNALRPWPAKAWYGPAVPRRADVPTEHAARELFVAQWSRSRRAYLDKVVADITLNPEAAARCFADLRVRCWSCGRALRDETSKTLGIGPECRSGMDPAVLARYSTPKVGKAHAEHLAVLRAAEASQ